MTYQSFSAEQGRSKSPSHGICRDVTEGLLLPHSACSAGLSRGVAPFARFGITPVAFNLRAEIYAAQLVVVHQRSGKSLPYSFEGSFG